MKGRKPDCRSGKHHDPQDPQQDGIQTRISLPPSPSETIQALPCSPFWRPAAGRDRARRLLRTPGSRSCNSPKLWAESLRPAISPEVAVQTPAASFQRVLTVIFGCGIPVLSIIFCSSISAPPAGFPRLLRLRRWGAAPDCCDVVAGVARLRQARSTQARSNRRWTPGLSIRPKHLTPNTLDTWPGLGRLRAHLARTARQRGTGRRQISHLV